MATKSTSPEPSVQSGKDAKRKRGRPGIVDAFSHLTVSRQRKWQLRQMSKGGCRICGEAAISKGYCLKHLVRERDYSASRFGYKRENQNCKSRLLQKLVENPQNNWKYQIVSARANQVDTNLAAQDILIQDCGALGWELTAAVPQSDGDIWFYFKKPVSALETAAEHPHVRKVQPDEAAKLFHPMKVSFSTEQPTQSANLENTEAFDEGHIVGV